MKHILFICTLSLLLCACEQTVHINQNGYEPRVSVESDIAADSVAKIYLTLTQNYYGYVDYKAPVQYVEDATVIIRNNGQSDELTLSLGKTDTVLVYNQNGGMDTIYTKRKYYRGHTTIVKGQKYELSILYKGKEITSELVVPNYTFDKMNVAQISKEIIDPWGGGSYWENFLEVKIKDPVGVGSFYRAKISYSYTRYEQDYNPITGNIEIIDSTQVFEQQISDIVSDEVNDGGEISFKMNPYIYSGLWGNELDTTYTPVYIEVQCLDKNMGKFWESLTAQWATSGDPFTEPTILYSNIKNGIGFFGAYQKADNTIFSYRTIE